MQRKDEISINHWLGVLVLLKEQSDEFTLENLLKTQGRILVGFSAEEFIDEAIFCVNYFADHDFIIITQKEGSLFTYWGIQEKNIVFQFTTKFEELLTELKGRPSSNLQEGSVAAIVHNYYGEYTAGDKISALSMGDNSPIITKSENITITYDLINQLENVIKKEYKNTDKNEILEAITEIKELSKDHQNKNTISSKLGWILTKTSELSTVALLITQILMILYKVPM